MDLALSLHLHHTGGSGLEHSIVPMMKCRTSCLMATLISTRTSFRLARDCPYASYLFCDLSDFSKKKIPYFTIFRPTLHFPYRAMTDYLLI